MKKTLILAGMLTLSACQVPAITPDAAQQIVGDNATLIVTPAIQAGLAARVVQAVVNPYTVSSINHLTLKLFTVAGGVETEVALNDITDPLKFTATVKFGNLSHQTTYRVRAYAYKSAGMTEQISDDANSAVDVVVSNDTAPTLASLQVKLSDIPFSAETTSTGTTIVDGGYSYSGPEAITPVPLPTP